MCSSQLSGLSSSIALGIWHYLGLHMASENGGLSLQFCPQPLWSTFHCGGMILKILKISHLEYKNTWKSKLIFCVCIFCNVLVHSTRDVVIQNLREILLWWHLYYIYIKLFRFIPESPRWLITQGKVKEAEVIVREAARKNKVQAPPVIFKESEVRFPYCY